MEVIVHTLIMTLDALRSSGKPFSLVYIIIVQLVVENTRENGRVIRKNGSSVAP